MAIHAFYPIPSRRSLDQIVSDLERAQRALLDDPDLAALYLDGALRHMLALAAGSHDSDNSARPDAALNNLVSRVPLLAQRFRLALRAPNPEARLIHCWNLLELLSIDAAPVAPRSNVVKG